MVDVPLGQFDITLNKFSIHHLSFGLKTPSPCLPVYPLVMTNIAIENVPVEIVDFTINSMVIFHSFCMFTRFTVKNGDFP